MPCFVLFGYTVIKVCQVGEGEATSCHGYRLISSATQMAMPINQGL